MSKSKKFKFEGSVVMVDHAKRFGFVTCKTREGNIEDMYLRQKEFRGDFDKLQEGDLIGFDDYTSGNRGNSIVRAQLMAGNTADMARATQERLEDKHGRPMGPSASDPWARGKESGEVKRNPNKEKNMFVEENAWGFAKPLEAYDWAGEDGGSWVGSQWIPHPKCTPGAVPSKEMLLALARGETTVDSVKEQLGEGPEKKERSRSRDRDQTFKDGHGAAEAILSCEDLADARKKYPDLMEFALRAPGSPGEVAFREHWEPGKPHHKSLRLLIAKVWTMQQQKKK